MLLYLIFESVFKRNHWGMGLFFLAATPRVRLVLNDLWLGMVATVLHYAFCVALQAIVWTLVSHMDHKVPIWTHKVPI